jgi:hypothetical protein
MLHACPIGRHVSLVSSALRSLAIACDRKLYFDCEWSATQGCWIYCSDVCRYIVQTFQTDECTGHILPRLKYRSTRLIRARLLPDENGSLLLDILHIALFAYKCLDGRRSSQMYPLEQQQLGSPATLLHHNTTIPQTGS